MGGRAFDLLTVLVQRHGEVVSKRELLALVWPGLVVEESNLKVNMTAIRRVLGEDTGAPRYIATVVGRGYRFVAPVQHSACQSGPHVPAVPRSGCPTPGAKRIFGREEMIHAVLSDLEHGRLVSLVGPGGAGKTTVALEVSNRAASVLKKAALFVDLSMAEEPSQVPEAIVNVIGQGDGVGARSRLPDGGLDDPHILLVLDNCEHLIGAVAQCVDQVLARTRNLKIILTSREPICIRGERVRRLHGLGLPPCADGLKAAEAMAYPALQMFVDRAAKHSFSFRLDDANAPAVAAICQRLDGLALAIERVAQRVGTLGVDGLLDHLDRRFHMLDGYHEGPERHRTLTAAVETSYVLLSPTEQATMRRVSAFAGLFSLDAACAISGAAGADRATVIEDIAGLVSKSLLTTESCDGEMLYRQTHVIRAFALDKLAGDGEQTEVRRRAIALGELDVPHPGWEVLSGIAGSDGRNSEPGGREDQRDVA